MPNNQTKPNNMSNTTYLIPLQRDAHGKSTVNARELHSFLDVGKKFADWIKDRIEQFVFVEGEDFTVISQFPEMGSGNRGAKIEYHISLDMAKELSMVERSEKGKKARQYFIECEKRLVMYGGFDVPQTLPGALRLAAELGEELAVKSRELAAAQPKIEFYDAVTASDTVCQMAVAAQAAQLPFGRNTLFQRLREMGVLISGGERHNLPKQEFIKQGLFTVKEHKLSNPKTGEPIVNFATHVTQKGIDWLVRQFGTQQLAG